MKNGITIAIQGKKEDGKDFGYICRGDGGWFFTLHEEKEETLASLEEDEMDGPGDVSHSEAYNALEDFLDR